MHWQQAVNSRSLKDGVNECAKQEFVAFDVNMGGDQDGLDRAIRKTREMFGMTKEQFGTEVLKEVLVQYGNKKELMDYVNGEKLCLPLLKMDTMICTLEPSPSLVARYVKSSLFVHSFRQQSFTLLTHDQVMVQVLLSLCPIVVFVLLL